MGFFDEQYLDSPIVRINLEKTHKDVLDKFFDFIVKTGIDNYQLKEELSTHDQCVFKIHKGVPEVEEVRKIMELCAMTFYQEFLPEVLEKGIDDIKLDSAVNSNTAWQGFVCHRHRPPYYFPPIHFTSVLYGMVDDRKIPGYGSIYFWKQSKESDNYDSLHIADTIKHDLEYHPNKYDLVLFTSDIWHQANRIDRQGYKTEINRYSIAIEVYGANYGNA